MKYFVSYFMSYDNRQQAWGNCVVKRDVPIFDMDQIQSVERLIADNNDAKQVTIMNWRRMEDAE